MSKKFPTLQSTRYPNDDQLIADGKVTSVVLFGQIDDGAITEAETGMRIFKKMGRNLVAAGYAHGKGDTWANLDVMSSVVEVSADANQFAAPAIGKLHHAIDHGKRSSWRAVLLTDRANVGDSTFGVSGVRDNCFTPTGSRCAN